MHSSGLVQPAEVLTIASCFNSLFTVLFLPSISSVRTVCFSGWIDRTRVHSAGQLLLIMILNGGTAQQQSGLKYFDSLFLASAVI